MLAARGCAVRAADAQERRRARRSTRPRFAGVELRLGARRPAAARRRRPGGAEPRRAARRRRCCAAAVRARHPGRGRDRAGVRAARLSDRRHHRHERQEHDDDAGRARARRRGRRDVHRRQPRHAARSLAVDDRRPTSRSSRCRASSSSGSSASGRASACLLNVTADHLDRHADFAEYRDAKARLFARAEAPTTGRC